MKKKYVFLFSGVSILLVIIVAYFFFIAAYQGVIAAMVKKASADSEMEAREMEYSLTQEFNITGTAAGGMISIDIVFPEYSINDISFDDTGDEGSITLNVNLPLIIGTREDKAYTFLILKGFTPEGAAGILANLTNELNDSSIKDDDFLDRLTTILTDTEHIQAIRTVKTAKDTEKAVGIWLAEFEENAGRLEETRRKAKAREYLYQYQGSKLSISKDSFRSSWLEISVKKDGDKTSFEGYLDNIEIAGYWKIESGKVTGRGYYGAGAKAMISSGVLQNPFGTQDYAIWCEWSQPRNDGLYSSKLMEWNGRMMYLRFHEGCDLGAAYGTKLYSVGSGVVERAEFNYQGYDGSLLIYLGVMKAPDGKMRKTWAHYGHISALAPGIKTGVKVNAGEYVANVGNQYGSNMPHLHLEIYVGAPIPDSQCDYCVDPAFYIQDLYKGQTGNCEPGLSGYPRGWSGYYRPDALFLSYDED